LIIAAPDTKQGFGLFSTHYLRKTAASNLSPGSGEGRPLWYIGRGKGEAF
jgi:hypothetical protein